MAPLLPTVTREQIKAIRDSAQRALHSLWTAGKKNESREIYGGMRNYSMYGWRNMPRGAADSISRARQQIARLPAESSGPLNAYMSTDAKSLYDAKSDGAIAPPQTNPKGVGSIGESVDAVGIPGSGVLTDVGGFLSALTQRNTWLRIGEGVLGLLLVGIGVAAITRGTPIGSAIRTGVKATPVGKVGKMLK